MDNQKGIKRYNLNLPEDLFNELQGLADAPILLHNHSPVIVKEMIGE